MVEEQKARIDEAVKKMVDDVDKSHLRQLQGKMFRCAAACCDDQNSSLTGVQRCIENCGSDLESAQHYVQQEFDHLQSRLQRCIMSCNDNIRDKMGPGVSDSEAAKYKKEFEGCAKKCVDVHIELAPSILKKMKEALSKKEYQTMRY